MLIENKVVVVTGANRGLGRALVGELLRRGAAKVYAAARREETLASLVEAHGARVVPLALDVTRPESIAQAAEKASDVNVLVNNAGLLASYGILSSSLASIRDDFEVNAFGLLATTKAFVPALERAVKRGEAPAVINVLSVASLANMPSLGGYSASKAAASSMSQAIRWELAKLGIQVFASYPGPIDTEMVKALEMPKTSAEAVAKSLLEAVAADVLDAAPDPTGAQFLATFEREPAALAKTFGAMSG
ncbi:MAG: SDR family NAD(P)-dependent oxidoreductase [Deltaproteobacteria bacterium]|nr:SDR family NAD(P)-dependent oxidoreductase [Deltaproteobacteria bacterium]